MSETIVEVRKVIRIKCKWNYEKESTYRYLYERPRGSDRRKGDALHYHDRFSGVKDIRDATDLNDRPIDAAMSLFYDVKEFLKNSDETIDLMDLTLTIQLEPVEFDPDAERDYLRSMAFQKLTEDEVRALGVENLAIFDKLKNHNT